jgi:hypothetical protein
MNAKGGASAKDKKVKESAKNDAKSEERSRREGEVGGREGVVPRRHTPR